ncbi:hypothetical protein NL676_011607 [Syzygium grande]|nr:hypothetical protein NL676_011607 [Syzygium grande]
MTDARMRPSLKRPPSLATNSSFNKRELVVATSTFACSSCRAQAPPSTDSSFSMPKASNLGSEVVSLRSEV